MMCNESKIRKIDNAFMCGHNCIIADVHTKMWMPIVTTEQWLFVLHAKQIMYGIAAVAVA